MDGAPQTKCSQFGTQDDLSIALDKNRVVYGR